ncbi:MAG: peptidase, partial [Thermomicrobiales bacterium]
MHAWRLDQMLVLLAISLFVGAAMGLVMPRGPVTSGDALMMMAASLAAGLGLGFLLRTRWVYLLGPLLSIVAFEIVRLGETGPTVDGLHLGTTFGILAFLTGRVIGYVLTFLPMATGMLLGRSIVRWRTRWEGWSSISKSVRVTGLAIPVIVVAALAFWIAQPASAPAVTGVDGNPAPNGVAELAAVNIGGVDQWIEIRGGDEDLPVLLYLSGGPGQSDLALSRALLDELTADFLLVGWDQRGTGKSYSSFDSDVISPDVAVADTIELTNYLRERFDE